MIGINCNSPCSLFGATGSERSVFPVLISFREYEEDEEEEEEVDVQHQLVSPVQCPRLPARPPSFLRSIYRPQSPSFPPSSFFPSFVPSFLWRLLAGIIGGGIKAAKLRAEWWRIRAEGATAKRAAAVSQTRFRSGFPSFLPSFLPSVPSIDRAFLLSSVISIPGVPILFFLGIQLGSRVDTLTAHRLQDPSQMCQQETVSAGHGTLYAVVNISLFTFPLALSLTSVAPTDSRVASSRGACPRTSCPAR